MLRLSLLLVLLMGCLGMDKSSIFNTEPYVDTVVDEKGKRLLADTSRHWRDFTELTHRRIARELDDARPPSVDTWNIHWASTINTIKNKTENAEKYINYIIVMRRNEGLPELVFEKN